MFLRSFTPLLKTSGARCETGQGADVMLMQAYAAGAEKGGLTGSFFSDVSAREALWEWGRNQQLKR